LIVLLFFLIKPSLDDGGATGHQEDGHSAPASSLPVVLRLPATRKMGIAYTRQTE